MYNDLIFNFIYLFIFFKSLIYLIKPDYDKWHPKKIKNKKLMYIAYGSELDAYNKEAIGIENNVFS